MQENKYALGWLENLYSEGMTDNEKYDKISKLYSMIHNSVYCDSMAGELSTKSPSAQALWWKEVFEHRFIIEDECERLRKKIELYEGESDENGKPHGSGKKYFIFGNWYEGEWKHGKRDGFGIEYAPDGTKRYEGFWENDKHCGLGVLVDYRGLKYEGYFSDKPPYVEYDLSSVKPSKITFPSGEIIEGPLRNGKFRCTCPNGDILECKRFTTPGRGTAVPVPMGEVTYIFKTVSESNYFDVILDKVDKQPLMTTKILCNTLGLGLAVAKDMVDNAPSTIASGVDKDVALALLKNLETIGNIVYVHGVETNLEEG